MSSDVLERSVEYQGFERRGVIAFSWSGGIPMDVDLDAGAYFSANSAVYSVTADEMINGEILPLAGSWLDAGQERARATTLRPPESQQKRGMAVSAQKIAIIGGDGIGKEVMAVGRKILDAYAQKRGIAIEVVELDLGADRFLRDGTTFPAEDQKMIREECSAVLLGALGDPRVPDLGYARDILFGLRFGLDLFSNIRPVICLHDRLMPLTGKKASDCNTVVFRENTEGVYVGIGGNFKKGTPDEVAINEDLNTRKGVERVIRAAFEYAVSHGRKRVLMSDKSNAMQYAHGLWQRTFKEVAAEYPAIESKHMYVDALCLQMIRTPEMLDVVVTNNLFGDIVTDLGAGLQGGLGMAASANVGAGKVGLFEPVHGSAPDIAGKDKANPLATVLTIGMMLDWLGHPKAEQELTDIVRAAIDQKQCTVDVGGTLGTKAVGEFVLGQVAALA